MNKIVRVTISVFVVGLSCSAATQVHQPFSDTTRVIDTTHRVDTLKTPRKKSELAQHVAKLQRSPSKPKLPIFSFQDSLRTRLVSERFNQKPAVDRTYFRSAGDYFRYLPQFAVMPYRETPMRTTVAPFGLANSRVNWVLDGYPVTLFEHVPEMDGMADAEDVPATSAQSAYVLPGPTGLLFGGDQALATLITVPESLKTFDPHSTMYVDKGDDNYSMTRGRFAKLYSDGRRTDLSIAYRKSGIGAVSPDDAYHYTAEFRVPVGDRWAVDAAGWLYTRDGSIDIGNEFLGISSASRYRFERHAAVSLMRSDSAHTSRSEVTYEFARQGSHFGIEYGRWFDQFNHAITLNREWMSGTTFYRVRAKADALKYDNGLDKHDRTTGDLSFSAVRSMGGWETAFSVGSKYDKDFKALPYGVATALRERAKSMINLSLGYAERPPTLHELYLPFDVTNLISGTRYADSGNTGLVAEKQLVGSLTGELGTLDNAVGVSVTGGRIENAIEWVRGQDSSLTIQAPVNVTRKFVGLSSNLRFRITDVARFLAGAGYSHVDRIDNRPQYYAPETQAFAGLELHWNWTQKLIHLRGYGELVYTARYHGYREEDLGKHVLANGALTFQMGGFRFFWIFRNILNYQFDPRDYISNYGRYTSFGFVWNFID